MSLLQELSANLNIDFPKIYNKHHDIIPEDAVLVDRTTRWGNPFKFTPDYERYREDSCNSFETYAMEKLLREPEWLVPLKGKDLVCWCHPKRCHAGTLVRLSNMPILPVEAFFDGLCEPAYPGGPRNPGGVAAGGWVISKHPFWWSLMFREIKGYKVYKSGTGATNNIAEYEAALDALRDIYRAKWRGRVTLWGDSQLVVNQYKGLWKCNSPHLRDLLEQLHRAADYFESVELLWTPRDGNKLADAQSRLAYQSYFHP